MEKSRKNRRKFWMAVCSLPQRRLRDDTDAGSSLYSAAVTEDAGVHPYCCADPGAGDWGECRDLYPGARGAAEEPAGGRSEDADTGGRRQYVLREFGRQRQRGLCVVLDLQLAADEEERAGVQGPGGDAGGLRL